MEHVASRKICVGYFKAFSRQKDKSYEKPPEKENILRPSAIKYTVSTKTPLSMFKNFQKHIAA